MSQAVLQPASNASRPAFRYSGNVYFQDGLFVTALLSGLLFLVMAVSLDAAGHVEEGMGVVIPVAIGAIATGALLSFSRFDSFYALSHALFVGLALILFLMSRLPTGDEIAPFLDKGVPELQARSYFVLLRLLNWVDAAINRSASADNYVFVFEISFLVWWVAFLGMWSILRHGYIWRGVIPAGAIMLINAYYAPESVLVLLALFSVLALFLLIRTNLAEQQLRWRESQVHVSQELNWEFVRTGLTYSVIVLTIAWLLPGLGRNVQMRQLLAPINERWEQTSQELDRLYQGLNRRPQPASGAFGRSLNLGGARNVGDGMIFNVATSAGRYWRAVVYDTYTGTGWLNTVKGEALMEPFQPAPIVDWRERAPLTQTISLMANTGNVVFGAPDIRQINMPVTALAASIPGNPLDAPAIFDGATGAFEFSMVRARETLDIGDRYTLLSSATAVSEQALRSAGTAYPPEIVDRYLQIPEGFSPRVIQLAQSLAAQATTPYDKAKTIEAYLRTIPYNDAIEAPGPDVDPIEYFLFEIQQGYCDYYATSMAMMLRVVGIPARTASGYAEGLFDEETGLYYVTERDAHTWVEVFFPELGWIEFEPTAGESELTRPTGEDEPSAILGQNQVPPTPDPSRGADGGNLQQPDPSDSITQDLDAVSDNTPWWLWALLTPIVLIAGLLLLWRMRSEGPSAFTQDLPLILFERLQGWGARLGISLQPHQTPYEQSRRLEKTLPEGELPIRTITHSYVLYRFSRPTVVVEPADGTVVTATGHAAEAQAWRTLQPVLLRAWLRKWLPRRTKTPEDLYELRPANGTPAVDKKRPTPRI
jgi:transglutaminase-like putative cysteine protease